MAEPTIAGIPTKDFDEWQAERVASGRAHVNDGGTMAGAEFATPADVAAKADASALTAHVDATTSVHGSNGAILGSGDIGSIVQVHSPALDEIAAGYAISNPVALWSIGYYYGPPGTRSTSALPVDREYAMPLVVPRAAIVDRIGVTVTAAGGAGAVARLGIRADRGDGVPGDLILDAGTIDVLTTGDKEIVIDQPLVGPLVWLTIATQSGTAATYRAAASSAASFGETSAINAGAANPSAGYQATGVIGPLPATYAVASSAALTPRVYVRCSGASLPFDPAAPDLYLDAFSAVFRATPHDGVASINTTTLAAAATAGSQTLEVVNAAGLAVGEVVAFGDGIAIETAVITAIAGTTITVAKKLVNDHSIGDGFGQMWLNATHPHTMGYRALAWLAARNMPNPGAGPVVVLGDSWGVTGFPEVEAAVSALYPAAEVIDASVSGNRWDQMNARFATDVAAHNPTVVIHFSGMANDLGQGRTAAEMQADAVTFRTLCRDAGITPVVLGVAPSQTAMSTSIARNIQVARALSTA